MGGATKKGYDNSLKTRRKAMSDKKKVFLQHLSEGNGIIAYACDQCSISRQTYYNWYNDDQEFRSECENITEKNVDMAESKLLNAIQDENLTAIIFYLKTKGKKRGYVEQTDQNINVGSFEELMKSLPDDEE